MAATQPTPNQEKAFRPAAAPGVVDPVCGMKVEGENPDLTVKYEGKEYRFCSKTCQDKFRTDPEQYAT
jgi:YHS domain-containing protein